MQYQALVILDCYITAACQTEPKEDGQSMWSAESPKAPRFTTGPFPGQFSARRKKGESELTLWDIQLLEQLSSKEAG